MFRHSLLPNLGSRCSSSSSMGISIGRCQPCCSCVVQHTPPRKVHTNATRKYVASSGTSSSSGSSSSGSSGTSSSSSSSGSSGGSAGTAEASTSTSSTSSSECEPSGSSCTVSYRGAVFSVPQGSKLRTAMLLAGVSPHNGRAQLINCRGLGTCGTCAVVIRGRVLPEQWCTAEQLRLNFPPHKAPNNQRLRLACQVTCEGPELEVIKRDKFWGQGDTVLGPAGPGDYSLPLGELEFILDGNRKQQ